MARVPGSAGKSRSGCRVSVGFCLELLFMSNPFPEESTPADAGLREGTSRERQIIAAQVIVTCPGRNFVTLKIETGSGVFGLGDATLNGRELAVAAYLEQHVVPNLIGRDAGRIEDTWQFLYRGAYWRRGPVTMTAIA